MTTNSLIFLLALIIHASAVSVAYAQQKPQLPGDYPNKSVRIVTVAAGGGADSVARPIAQSLTGSLGQPVIVENRPTIIAIETVARAPSDGYTLLVAGSTIWILPLLQSNLPWDPVRDFSPIALATASPLVLVVHPSVPVKSVKELIALAKAKPGMLNYAAGPNGSANHLTAELFKSMAAVNMVLVPYKGAQPAIIDLISGQVQLLFASTGNASPHVKSGRLRALAVTSGQPSALAPGLPTMAAAGLTGFEAVAVNAVLAPAKTSATIINRLNQEIVRFLNRPEVKERFLNAETEAAPTSPEELAARIKSETISMGKVIKDAGIKAAD